MFQTHLLFLALGPEGKSPFIPSDAPAPYSVPATWQQTHKTLKTPWGGVGTSDGGKITELIYRKILTSFGCLDLSHQFLHTKYVSIFHSLDQFLLSPHHEPGQLLLWFTKASQCCVCVITCQDKLQRSSKEKQSPTNENIFRNPTVHKKSLLMMINATGNSTPLKGNGEEMKPYSRICNQLNKW